MTAAGAGDGEVVRQSYVGDRPSPERRREAPPVADLPPGTEIARSEAIGALGERLTQAGLRGTSEADLLALFCFGVREAGIPLTRALVIVDTLHPVHEGRLFRWRSDAADTIDCREYGRTNRGGEAADSWRGSPFFRMLETGAAFMRHRLVAGGPHEYPAFANFCDDGQTDWLGLIHRFDGAVIGEMDCIYSSWTTDRPDGFDTDQLKALKRLVPALGLAVKSASLARIAETLVETYLGRDAGRRVLAGRIERGVAERIHAALWFSDLRGYTRITGAARPDEIIPLLNDYAEAVISAVEEAGGDVLKLIGDGTLAIFNAATSEAACRCALAAEAALRDAVARLNERRAAAELPTTQVYLGLHIGDVFYGNVGSQTRLDFTVVGPAVNEVARIAALCRSAERDALVSGTFRAALPEAERGRLVSVGRYALRGVDAPQELFTPDRTA